MTTDRLHQLLRKFPNLYSRFPELNDSLYLNDQEWSNLGGLHDFLELKVLHAEGNCMKTHSH